MHVHWFRKGLRLHDNPALLKAASGGETLLPIFILDPFFQNSSAIGKNRFGFVMASLHALDSELRKLNSQLVIAVGTPEQVFKRLFEVSAIKLLTYEEDIEPYARSRDVRIRELIPSSCRVETAPPNNLHPADVLLKYSPKHQAPTSYRSLLKCLELAGPIPSPLDAPTFLPLLPPESVLKPLYSSGLLLRKLPSFPMEPSLEEDAPFWIEAGEAAAIRQLEAFCANRLAVRTFNKPNTSPTTLQPSTTALSAHLKVGSLSVRRVHATVQQILLEPGSKGDISKPPVSLLGQLYWREFYYLASMSWGNVSNIQAITQFGKSIPWRQLPECSADLSRWENGQTGFPAVDACMNQLRREGWMHHLGRHLVACFLTRGDLWIDWRLGGAVFEKYLIDADWPLNVGNWMWLSCTAYFTQYWRVYSPIVFFKKYDPHGAYIRKWVPQLKHYDDKYIYEPWKAPKASQIAWKCTIGDEASDGYPNPMCDHGSASKINIQRMREAYNAEKEEAVESDEPLLKKVKKT